jgi:hypothetical protein
MTGMEVVSLGAVGTTQRQALRDGHAGMTGFERWVPIVRLPRGEGKIFATVCTLFILAERMLQQFDVNLRCSGDATSDARRGAAQA